MGFTERGARVPRAGTPATRRPTARSRAASTGAAPTRSPEHDSNGAVHLRVARVLPLHARRRLRARAVAARDPRGRLHGRAARAAHDRRRTASPDKQAFFGLLPESISHEGYSAHPVHSYWDDFFALRGLKDAAMLARSWATTSCAASYAALRDAVPRRRSTRRSRARWRATASTTCPARSSSATSIRPRPRSRSCPAASWRTCRAAPLQRTFERYWEEFEQRRRRDGEREALHALRAAQRRGARPPRPARPRARAARLPHRRPAAGGVERVGRGRLARSAACRASSATCRTPGSAPASSSAVRTHARLRARERPGAGARRGHRPGVGDRGAGRHGASAAYALGHPQLLRPRQRSGCRAGSDLGDLAIPPGKIVLASPLDRPITTARVNGKVVELSDPTQVRIDAAPADIELSYRQPSGGAGSRAWTPGYAIARVAGLFQSQSK